MKKIYTALILISIVVLSVSQMYLWKDQRQMWQQFDLHLKLSNNPSTPA